MSILLEARQVRKTFHSGGGMWGAVHENVAVDGFSLRLTDAAPALITIA